MTKKTLKRIIISALVVSFGTLLVAVGIKVNHKKQIESTTVNLSDFSVINAEGDRINSKLFKDKLVLIFFNSTCEHCQSEINDLKKHYSLFHSTQVILLSSETLSVINSFAESVKMNDLQNFAFCHISPEDLYQHFGTISYPEIYIYNNQSLVKHLKGETKVEVILSNL